MEKIKAAAVVRCCPPVAEHGTAAALLFSGKGHVHVAHPVLINRICPFTIYHDSEAALFSFVFIIIIRIYIHNQFKQQTSRVCVSD